MKWYTETALTLKECVDRLRMLEHPPSVVRRQVSVLLDRVQPSHAEFRAELNGGFLPTYVQMMGSITPRPDGGCTVDAIYNVGGAYMAVFLVVTLITSPILLIWLPLSVVLFLIVLSPFVGFYRGLWHTEHLLRVIVQVFDEDATEIHA